MNALRKALIVGIDDYPGAPLYGCVRDAKKIYDLLHRNEDRTLNYACNLLVSDHEEVTTRKLKKSVCELFNSPADSALLYFAGHGTRNLYGGYLVAMNAREFEEGLSFNEVLQMANESRTREVTILIDCCFSGAMGAGPGHNEDKVILREGVSILTSSLAYQESMETKEGGLFSQIVIDSLKGASADLLGNVSVAGLYSQADKMLGAWDQRPMFKSNLSRMALLRKCKPLIPLEVLLSLVEYFPNPNSLIQLGPAYEPTEEPRDPAKEKLFHHLQLCAAQGLVEPIGADHLYWASIYQKSCGLTLKGKFYWKRVNNGHI